MWLYLCESEEPRLSSTLAMLFVYSNLFRQKSILITSQRGFISGHPEDMVALASCMKTQRQRIHGITTYGKSFIIVDERNSP